MIKRILAAVDGSAMSRRAVAYGAGIAKKFDAGLVLIYVIRDMQIPDGVREVVEVSGFRTTRLTAMQTVGRQILDEFSSVAAEAGVARVEKVVRPGDPAGTILRYATDNDIDLIVMGSRGLGEVESMLLGSVSRKVANLSKVACLTVK